MAKDQWAFQELEGSFPLPTFGGEPERALPTKGSRFVKVLNFLNRPNSAKNDFLTDFFRGNITNKTFKKMGESLSGKRITAGDSVLAAVVGVQKKDAPKMEKIGRAITGFAIDVVSDPLNLIAIGPLTKVGKAAQKLHKPLGTVAESLMGGNRAALALGPIKTPASVNRIAAHTVEYGKNVLKNLPFADTIGTAFQGLSTRMGLIQAKQNAAKVAQLVKKEKYVVAARESVDALAKRIKVEGAEKVIGREAAQYYSKLGYDAQKMAESATTAVLERPLHTKAALKTQELMDTVVSSKMDPTKAIDGRNAEVILSSLEKTPLLGRKIPSSRELINAVKALGKMRAGIKRTAINAGLAKPEDFMRGYVPRTASESARKVLEGLGGASGGGRGFLSGIKLTGREFPDFTTDQVKAIISSPEAKRTVVSESFGTAPIMEKTGFWKALAGARPKETQAFDSDIVKAMTARMVEVENAASVAGSFKNMKDAGFIGKDLDSIAGTGHIVDFGSADSPGGGQFAEAIKDIFGTTRIAIRTDAEQDIKRLVSLMSNDRALNDILSALDMPLNAWKRITLYFPLQMFMTSTRNLFGGLFLSHLKGVNSPEAAKYAAMYSGNVIRRAWSKGTSVGDDAGELIARAYDNVQIKGQNEVLSLGDEIRTFEKSGILSEGMPQDVQTVLLGTRGEKIVKNVLDSKLMTAGQPLNEGTEAFNRFYHYIARRKDGWSKEAALADTLETHYNYGGLAPFEKGVMRRIFPFYAWVRLNSAAMLTALLKSPGKSTSATRSAINNWEATYAQPEDGTVADEQVLDEFIKGDLHVRLYKGKDGKFRYFRLKNWLPIADMEDFTGPQKLIDLAMSSTNPMFKVPLEMVTNKSTFFKVPGGDAAPIERFPGEMGTLGPFAVPKKVESAVKGLVRPYSEVDRLLGEYFGKKGEPNIFGAVRTTPKLSWPEKAAALFSLRTPVSDPDRQWTNAIYQYRKELSKMKGDLKYAEKKNRPKDIENLMRSIQDFQTRRSIEAK